MFSCKLRGLDLVFLHFCFFFFWKPSQGSSGFWSSMSFIYAQPQSVASLIASCGSPSARGSIPKAARMSSKLLPFTYGRRYDSLNVQRHLLASGIFLIFPTLSNATPKTSSRSQLADYATIGRSGSSFKNAAKISLLPFVQCQAPSFQSFSLVRPFTKVADAVILWTGKKY